MSLAIKYETVDDAHMRLRNTVVLYRGEPVLIREVQRGDGEEGIFRVLFTEIPRKPQTAAEARAIAKNEDTQRKYISSKYFDIAPFKMGYINRPDKNGAFYCSRMPNRMQKQGLCGENFFAVDNLGNQVGFDTFLSCKETAAMVRGEYPSFDRALQALTKVPAVAFHREFCLQKDPVLSDFTWLYHKGGKVGMVMDGAIKLGDKFKCLRETLQEAKLRVS